MQNITFDKNLDELKKNVYSLYVLYKHVKEGETFHLPDFIDRGKTYHHLIKMGFAFEVANKKHIHKKPYDITPDGNSFIIDLERQFDCNQIFNSAPLDNKNDFDVYFVECFIEGFNDQSLDDILSLCIKAPLGKRRYRNNVELTFLEYKKLKDNGKIFEYLFRFKTICIRCKQELRFEQKTPYNSEVYSTDPSFFNAECHCGLKFHIDAYITNWWFDEEE